MTSCLGLFSCKQEILQRNEETLENQCDVSNTKLLHMAIKAKCTPEMNLQNIRGYYGLERTLEVI